MKYYRSHVLFCVDPECLKKVHVRCWTRFRTNLSHEGLIDEVQVLETSRIGDCDNGPEMMVYPKVCTTTVTVDDIPFLVEEHFLKGRIAEEIPGAVVSKVDEELQLPLLPKKFAWSCVIAG